MKAISTLGWIWIGLAVFWIVVGGCFYVFVIHPKPTPAQIVRSSASAVATASAAQEAVNVVAKQSDTEKTIDAATTVATKAIGNAQTPSDIRSAVIRAVCVQHGHSTDPACRVQQANPK